MTGDMAGRINRCCIRLYFVETNHDESKKNMFDLLLDRAIGSKET